MYFYDIEKPYVFTEAGQRQFLKVRDFCRKTLQTAGAVSAGKALAAAGGGDSFHMMACVDRLVDMKEIVEVTTGGAWQCRVFVNGTLIPE